MKHQSQKTKRLIAAGMLTVAVSATVVPNTASAGPVVCAGAATVAAAAWLGYGIFKVVTAPVTIWTTPAEVAPLVAAGGATIEAVTAACVAPTP